MKIIHRNLSKDGEGKVGLIPEESDDLWSVFNLIQKFDQIQASTWRKVVNVSNTGSTGSSRVKINLTISAEKVEYDFEANIIKIKGRNVTENKHVKKGQYHTLVLELNRRFFLIKKIWDSLALSLLKNACDPNQHSEVAMVMMQEGLAFICLMTEHMCIQKSKIEVNIPRKRKNFCSQHQKGFENFYEQILQAIIKYINLELIKCIIVASPGFVKDQFLEYLWKQALKDEYKILLENKGKFISTHSSTGFKHSIGEILSNPDVQAKLEDTKAVQEVKLWKKFQELLNTYPNRAIYGFKEVEIAHSCHAISHLMISDSLFRSNDLAMRKKYSKLIYEVKSYGGEVKVFSTMHQTGQQFEAYCEFGFL